MPDALASDAELKTPHPTMAGGGTFTLKMEMSPDVVAVLTQLSEDSKQGIEDVIRSALGLYKMAVEATRKGKVVGIADAKESDHLETLFF